MKNLGLIGLLFVLMTTVTFAQGHHKRGKAKLSPEAKAALKELQEKEIYPAKKAMYDDFMGQLSEEDKAFLAAKRQENEAIRTEARAVHKQLRADKKEGKEVDHKTAMAAVHKKREALMTSMRPFLEAQKVNLDGIMRKMEEQNKEWKTKKKAIIEKYTSAEDKKKMEERKEKIKGNKDKKEEGNRFSDEDKEMMKAARFVLWDGEMKQRKEHTHRKEGRGKKSAE